MQEDTLENVQTYQQDFQGVSSEIASFFDSPTYCFDLAKLVEFYNEMQAQGETEALVYLTLGKNSNGKFKPSLVTANGAQAYKALQASGSCPPFCLSF